ncbi:MAG: DNA starvation/stationary phase protection protein [Ruaniaceae bacterium]|nr:DNA starvation/stationary phase protection protein [Ruaniaceae bacterium]
MAESTTTRALQQGVVDLIALELQAKQAHWNVRGPQFRSLHLALDEVVAAARTQLDEVAERLSQIGGTPDGRPATVIAGTVLDEIDGGILQTDKAYALMAEKVQKVSDSIKESIKPVDDEDPVSSDLLIQVSAALDLQAWFLRAATE